mgnify:CR=1 FL=1|jgi:hypothetical protein|tara:strand:+ start:1167 stop:1343 length:177 start_codon:yes stop_codon:yes gene_type:complete
MLGSFFLVLRLGHVPVIALIFLVQMSMVKELFALAVETRKEKGAFYTQVFHPPLGFNI